MNVPQEIKEKLGFYQNIVLLEIEHLKYTDQRVFSEPFTEQRAQTLSENKELAEKIDAFVSRFGRLQDTLGDKLLPTLLSAMNERQKAFIDNLDKAEKLGLLESVDSWVMLRNLRNKMVHEYIKDYAILASALQTAHEHIPMLEIFAINMMAEMDKRQFLMKGA